LRNRGRPIRAGRLALPCTSDDFAAGAPPPRADSGLRAQRRGDAQRL